MKKGIRCHISLTIMKEEGVASCKEERRKEKMYIVWMAAR
jgi:hypothetical protein